MIRILDGIDPQHGRERVVDLSALVGFAALKLKYHDVTAGGVLLDLSVHHTVRNQRPANDCGATASHKQHLVQLDHCTHVDVREPVHHDQVPGDHFELPGGYQHNCEPIRNCGVWQRGWRHWMLVDVWSVLIGRNIYMRALAEKARNLIPAWHALVDMCQPAFCLCCSGSRLAELNDLAVACC